ncbi:putative RNA-binding protein EIF1AD [Canna indica]|uniref:RNA-binding protein EIF1AD n=1 Tax=Canna indica TaxID=4628 RepID=A0AAQ3Q9Y5_9LILI|nr:putative RNA-binding protein EIF1AD [Canna indica]
MKAGRKNFKRGLKEDSLSLQEGQSIMQVVSLRGSNVIEVLDAKAVKSLALLPAKFHKSFWIKRGSFVVVDESGREKAIESGSKISCIVLQVLFHDQVRELKKSSDWPAIFTTTTQDDITQQPPSECNEGVDSDSEDGLPPLEANMNRNRHVEMHSASDGGSDSDSGSGSTS